MVKAILFAVLFAFQGGPETTVTVEGDRRLLDLVHAAQLSNRAAFPRGKMLARVQSTARNKRVEVSSSVIWSENGTYWDYNLTETRGAAVVEQQAVMMKCNDLLICYWPKLKFVQKIFNGKLQHAEELSLRPEEAWFRIEGLADWAKSLDADSPSVRGPIKYVVRREGAEHVVIERHTPHGGLLRIVASLELDGNIVAYEGTPGKASTPIWRKGTYEWAKHGTGGWYLKRYEYARTHEGNRKDPEFRYVLEVESFDSKPFIPKDRFSEASLELPPGTVVEEVGKGEDRRYKIGQEDGVSQKDLDDLSRRLRAMKFAAPK